MTAVGGPSTSQGGLIHAVPLDHPGAPPLCCPTGHSVLLVDPSQFRPAVPQAPYRSEGLLEEQGFDPPAPELRQNPEEYHPQLVCPPTPQKEA